MGILIFFFIVGLIVVMLFSKEGRGCLGGAIGLVLTIVVITAIGAFVVIGGIYLLAHS